MNRLILLSVYIFLLSYEVDAYKTGAPEYVCNSMMPNHKADPQQITVPYKLTVKPQNGKFEVSIQTTKSGDYFRGFFIQAREESDRNAFVKGEFSLTENTKLVACDNSEKSAITHNDNNDKTEVTTTWTPPYGFEGNIVFRATIVRTGQVFWTEVDSGSFHVSQNENFSVSTKKPSNDDDLMSSMYEKCGVERGCFGLNENCIQSKNCIVLLSYFYDINKNLVEFEIMRKIDSNFEGWIAAGISEDNLMGSDSVGDCIIFDGKPSFHYSWNEGRENKIMNEISEIKGLSAKAEDGILNCRWTRDIEILENGMTFNLLNNEYYILLAKGPMKTATEKKYHDYRLRSETAVNLTSIGIIDSGSPSSLIKAHGSLMVISWVGLVSIGILLARHYKDAWGEKTLCNVKIWFAFHRAFMLTSVLMIISAFIIIFVHVGAWSSSAKLHAILGCISTGFAILQPIGAFFRPGPTDSKRPIFNWSHWLGGNIGYILAIITIFLSSTLSAASLPKAFFWVFAIFVIYHTLFQILMQIYIWQLEKRKKNEINMVELSGEKTENKILSSFTFKQKLLAIYVFPVIGLVITLVLIICLQ